MISVWVFTPRQNWFMIDIYETFTPVNKPWPIGSVFVYELCGCEFKSWCSHLSFRYRIYFEKGGPLSCNYRGKFHPKRICEIIKHTIYPFSNNFNFWQWHFVVFTSFYNELDVNLTKDLVIFNVVWVVDDLKSTNMV